MLPEEFSPKNTALGSMFLPVMGRSSGRLRQSGLMLYRTQCTQVPAGASGSSTIKAKDCVPAGGSPQLRSGDTFLPTHEYLAGIDCPFVNALLLSCRDISASEVGVEVEEHEVSRMVNSKLINDIFLIKYLPLRRPRTAE